MTLTNGSKRYFNGFVSEFAQTGQDAQFIYYQAEMVPWLWFLSQTSDCRIFQNKTVPEIAMQLFQELGFRDFRNALQGIYEKLDVALQYRETKFNFIFPIDGAGRDVLFLRARTRQAHSCDSCRRLLIRSYLERPRYHTSLEMAQAQKAM